MKIIPLLLFLLLLYFLFEARELDRELRLVALICILGAECERQNAVVLDAFANRGILLSNFKGIPALAEVSRYLW